MLKIIHASASDMDTTRTLFLEYADSLDFDLCFQNFDQELATLPGAYGPPGGSLLLAYHEGELAGCIALRRLEASICEMKRLYVRPAFQGKGIGKALSSQLMKWAVELGYLKMRLDTVSSMKAAISLYQSLGFYEIPAYCKNPLAGATYMEKNLRDTP